MSETDKPPCKVCGSTDRTPAGACRPCKARHNAAYAAKKAAGGGSAVKRKRKTTKRDKAVDVAAIPARPLKTSLVLEAGYGVTAKIEDGYLQLTQSDSEGATDTLMLSRSEARRLFEEFEEWANA